MDAKDREIDELKALLQTALEKIARLESENARLKKNSTNSSKPPKQQDCRWRDTCDNCLDSIFLRYGAKKFNSPQ
jgi:hypothetical protein